MAWQTVSCKGKFVADEMVAGCGNGQRHMAALADAVVALLKSRSVTVRTSRPISAIYDCCANADRMVYVADVLTVAVACSK